MLLTFVFENMDVWRHKGCSWLLWLKILIFYCWIFISYLPIFQIGFSLVYSWLQKFLTYVIVNSLFWRLKGCSWLLWWKIYIFYCWIFILYLTWFQKCFVHFSSLLLMFMTSKNENIDFWRHNECSWLLPLKILIFIVRSSYPICLSYKFALHFILACSWCSWLLWWKIWIFRDIQNVPVSCY